MNHVLSFNRSSLLTSPDNTYCMSNISENVIWIVFFPYIFNEKSEFKWMPSIACFQFRFVRSIIYYEGTKRKDKLKECLHTPRSPAKEIMCRGSSLEDFSINIKITKKSKCIKMLILNDISKCTIYMQWLFQNIIDTTHYIYTLSLYSIHVNFVTTQVQHV